MLNPEIKRQLHEALSEDESRGSVKKRRKTKKKRGFLRRAFKTAVVTGLLGTAVGVPAGLYHVHNVTKDLPDVRVLTEYQPPAITRILANDRQTELGRIYLEKRTPIPFADIPQHVKLAFLAAEDSEFYEHPGYNLMGMARGGIKSLFNKIKGKGGLQGGSTLTQQVVKNVLKDDERSIDRKIRELALSRSLEERLGGTQAAKDKIFNLYLNQIDFPDGTSGIEEASKSLFGKNAKDLTLGEGALLAALPKAPEKLSPRKNMAGARGRRDDYVLPRMVELGYISAEDAEKAKNEPITIVPRQSVGGDPEIIEYVRKEMTAQLSAEQVKLGGYTIVTSIDARLQAAARAAVRDKIRLYDDAFRLQVPFKRNAKKTSAQGPGFVPFTDTPKPGGTYIGRVTGTDDQSGMIAVQVGTETGVLTMDDIARYNPDNLPPSKAAEPGALLRVTVAGKPKPGIPLDLNLEDHGPQAALVSIDVQSGWVTAMVGSYEGGFGLNRAVDVKRQPGSGFKPFHYSYALELGVVTPVTPFEINDRSEGHKTVSFRRGVEISNNDVAKKTLIMAAPRERDLKKVISWIGGFGIDTSEMKPDRSLALGSYEVSPLQMAEGYAVFARGGVRIPSTIVLSVHDRNGAVLYEAKPEPVRVIKESTAYMMTDILKGVVENGTAKKLKVLRDATRYAMAAKTGTTNRPEPYDNQSGDLWLNLYTPDTVVTGWIGYDKYGKDIVGLGAGEGRNYGATGGMYVGPIMESYMREALTGRVPQDFGRPSSGLIEVDVASNGHIYGEMDDQSGFIPIIPPQEPPSEHFYPEEMFKPEYCAGGETTKGYAEDAPDKPLIRCVLPGRSNTVKAIFLESSLPTLLENNPPAPEAAQAPVPVLIPPPP